MQILNYKSKINKTMVTNVKELKKKLPTISELITDFGSYDKQDKLNFLLSQKVPQDWIAKHPYISIKDEKGKRKPYEYLPIDKTEYLLRKVFKRYRIEVKGYTTAFNGVVVDVRVNYFNFVYNEWDFHDGIGAIHLQVKSGSSPSDLSNINNGALSMAFPLAKTLAIKDACDHFGDLFGANLNRKGTLSAILDAPKEKIEEIKLLLQVEGLTISEEDRMYIKQIVETKEKISYDKAILILNNSLPKKS